MGAATLPVGATRSSSSSREAAPVLAASMTSKALQKGRDSTAKGAHKMHLQRPARVRQCQLVRWWHLCFLILNTGDFLADFLLSKFSKTKTKCFGANQSKKLGDGPLSGNFFYCPFFDCK